ncbi:MAG TPA: proline dehydrogenase family protein, partial [Chthonomonadaceae bacterium]|nr:proline dehydrogenase family protein [Chthonomonadaceae bacterium]
FVAGETIEEAVAAVRSLNAQGIAASVDLLGESVRSREQVAQTLETYIRVFDAIRANSLDCNVSIKLTALGLDIDEALCFANMTRLLTAAGPDQFVRIDMESSAYTDRTLELFTKLWEGPEPRRNVGVVIQAYLRRSAADIERLIAMGARVRLCKGAYNEPPDVAFPDKADVDASFVALMRRLLSDGNYPGIATHDEKMIDATRAWSREQSIGPERFEFQMLYGIRRDLQVALVKEGWRMRVYTPFGDYWYPYLMRRLAERPANLLFVVKNALRG